ncbi:hypothetical protein TNIN_447141 [Trichonephila inaurata madagascariensis]|uniref:Uncharacterized protein n=1 Tax=Trichonephila inaurata madagascariensis TaxID=2747483 RepID=A0A8X7CC53_9ARAC|nr:hypothetical protein TNIN_447141 [Trichonephila inaurata madagascariensis]
MENTQKRLSGKRPQKRRFRGNQFTKICPHTNDTERRDTVYPCEERVYQLVNNKLSLAMKEVAEESIKRAAVEQNSSSPDNLLAISGDGSGRRKDIHR